LSGWGEARLVMRTRTTLAALAGTDEDNRASETPSEQAAASSAPTAAARRLCGRGTSRVLAAPLR